MKLASGSSFVLALISAATAQKNCAGDALPKANVAKGFTARVLVRDMGPVRGLQFDKDGHLLALVKGKGIIAITLKEDTTGCGLPTFVSKKTLAGTTRVNNSNLGLNHAIELSEDGKTLYASSVDKVYSWPYNGKTATIAGDIRTVIQGMYPGRFGHETRTLELSKKAPGMMLVSLGSAGNFDKAAKDIKTGISQIRAFNISSGKTYNYTDGEVIGWGLRNSVGLAESPQGGIWSNENGSDDVSYGTSKIDVHENSPGEEINYHGSLVGDRSLIGKNYGYPHCAAMWSTTGMTEANLKVGQHFAVNPPPAPLGIGEDLYKTQGVLSNAQCQKDYVAPRLTVPPHWAPLDIKFNSKGSVAYMTAHGSWNKAVSDGYLVFAIDFENGQPKHLATSKTAAISILSNKNTESACDLWHPLACFRPTGLAFDSKGSLYMSSDVTGEIYVIGRADGSSVDSLTAVEPTV